jgi:hypothetical protein
LAPFWVLHNSNQRDRVFSVSIFLLALTQVIYPLTYGLLIHGTAFFALLLLVRNLLLVWLLLRRWTTAAVALPSLRLVLARISLISLPVAPAPVAPAVREDTSVE